MGKEEQVILLRAMLGPGMMVRQAMLSVLEGKLSACQLFPSALLWASPIEVLTYSFSKSPEDSNVQFGDLRACHNSMGLVGQARTEDLGTNLEYQG